jgi:hypothetical protein
MCYPFMQTSHVECMELSLAALLLLAVEFAHGLFELVADVDVVARAVLRW